MNKKLFTIIIIIIAFIGAGFAYLMLQDKPSDNNQASTSSNTADTTPQGTENTEQTGPEGQYVAYDESRLTATEGTKILFFHAPWCPQCRALESSINESTIPSNVTIFKVDYDTNQALRQKYGVTIQTTLVKVDDEGNFIEKYVAYDEPNFAAVKENLL